jgi:hypothetical protein
MNTPVLEQGRGDIQLPADQVGMPHGITAEQKIRWFVERAIGACGSAAALARQLQVSRPTVSQWRSGLKKPDAINLIRVQQLANEWPSPREYLQSLLVSAGNEKE